jgi:hypothetical protein
MCTLFWILTKHICDEVVIIMKITHIDIMLKFPHVKPSLIIPRDSSDNKEERVIRLENPDDRFIP